MKRLNNDYTIKTINAVHMEGSFGFVITKNKMIYIIGGDTYLNDDLVAEINSNPKIKLLILECSFQID